jgi:hypothetical protein
MKSAYARNVRLGLSIGDAGAFGLSVGVVGPQDAAVGDGAASPRNVGIHSTQVIFFHCELFMAHLGLQL